MSDEDKTFSGSFVLDLRIWWRQAHTLYNINRMTARKVQDNRVNTNISTEWQEWLPGILKTKRHEMYSQNTNDMWV